MIAALDAAEIIENLIEEKKVVIKKDASAPATKLEEKKKEGNE